VIYGTNPNAPVSSGDNTSSILLFRPPDLSEYRVVTDVSVDSVLHGLSNIGGIFTTANGIFIFVFGWGIIEDLGLGRFALLRRDQNDMMYAVTPMGPGGEDFGLDMLSEPWVRGDVEAGGESK